jgi:hypothetical protein
MLTHKIDTALVYTKKINNNLAMFEVIANSQAVLKTLDTLINSFSVLALSPASSLNPVLNITGYIIKLVKDENLNDKSGPNFWSVLKKKNVFHVTTSATLKNQFIKGDTPNFKHTLIIKTISPAAES